MGNSSKAMSEDTIKLPFGNDKPVFSSPKSFTHQLHLKGPVGDQEDYIDWVRTIRGAGPDDVIEFHINSPGGNVYTAIELLNAFQNTEAHVHVVMSGIVASAGTILMMVGDSFEINPWTSFMFHNYSGGMRGKGNEMAIQMEYEREWSKKFMSEIYDGLLTKKEVKQLLDGRDFWLSADDVGKRLSKMIEERQKAMEEALKELEEALADDEDDD